MTIKEAREYINFNIKEGVFDESEFEGMTDEQLIQRAEDEMLRADLYWDDVLEMAMEQ